MAGWEKRFGTYAQRLGDVLGHADRREPLRAYAIGLLLPLLLFVCACRLFRQPVDGRGNNRIGIGFLLMTFAGTGLAMLGSYLAFNRMPQQSQQDMMRPF